MRLTVIIGGAMAALTLAGHSVMAQTTSAAQETRAPVKRLVPAKQLFGAAKTAAPLQARAIGRYSRGCLAGAKALPINGPAWQAMRLSRNRNWGHPVLVAFLERFAKEAQKHDGWPGLLVGDMAQPRGGPMLTGHASHQIGLDADIWFTPMPSRILTVEEREKTSAVSMLAADKLSVDAYRWTTARSLIVKRAASSPEVARIFVHPAIKKALCSAADAGSFGKDRAWLAKVRPWWGHHYHFHIRMTCPKGSAGCVDQPDPGPDDGCGAELASWYKRLTAPPTPAKPRPPKPPMTIEALPDACKLVLAAGAPDTDRKTAGGALVPSAAAKPAADAPAKLGAGNGSQRKKAKVSDGVPQHDLPPVFRH